MSKFYIESEADAIAQADAILRAAGDRAAVPQIPKGCLPPTA